MKYPFLSEINANNQNPLKLLFEALNYYMSFKAWRAKTDHRTVFKTSQPLFTTSKYLLKWFGEIVLCSLYTKLYNFEGMQFTSVNVMREKHNFHHVRSLQID